MEALPKVLGGQEPGGAAEVTEVFVFIGSRRGEKVFPLRPLPCWLCGLSSGQWN